MTIEKIPLIEKDIANMSEKLDNLTKDFKEHSEKMEAYFERLETKFAGKWTEKIIIFVGGAIGTIIIGAVMALIIKG